MKYSETLGITKLAAALVAAQRELEPIAKSATNRFNKKYASLDTITEAVRPVLAKHGLAVVQGATLPTTDADGRLTAFTLETMLIHESGEWLTNGVVFPVGTTPVKDKDGNIVGGEPTAQNAGATVTYGRRYGLASLLVLTTDEDDDGTQASERAPKNGGNQSRASAPESKPVPVAKAADIKIPFNGKLTRLGDMDNHELTKLLEIAKAEARFAKLAVAMEEVLEERRNLPTMDSATGFPFPGGPNA